MRFLSFNDRSASMSADLQTASASMSADLLTEVHLCLLTCKQQVHLCLLTCWQKCIYVCWLADRSASMSDDLLTELHLCLLTCWQKCIYVCWRADRKRKTRRMSATWQQRLRHVCNAGNLNMFVQASCVLSTSQSLSVHVTGSCDRDWLFNIRLCYHKAT
jgi:hypothetical protein